MRVAQIAPLFESVPPRQYGGTERVVFNLTEELVRMGHQVTLFATGDSLTSAELRNCWPQALRLSSGYEHSNIPHMLMVERVLKEADQYDILHFHIDYIHYPFMRHISVPHVTTLHGRLDHPFLEALYQKYPEEPVISISDSQRAPLTWLNWVGTVHHGICPDSLSYNGNPQGYLAFLGRMSREKRPDRAIMLALETGLPLKMAAKVDVNDREYFDSVVVPLLKKAPNVEFIGEISDREKGEFLGNAMCLLFPIDWPEPFGLVMIESMACGTPVLAFNCGSVSEVIDEGVTGFTVDNMDAALARLSSIQKLSRIACRQQFENRFSRDVMAKKYLKVYESLMEGQTVAGIKPVKKRNAIPWKISSNSITKSI